MVLRASEIEPGPCEAIFLFVSLGGGGKEFSLAQFAI